MPDLAWELLEKKGLTDPRRHQIAQMLIDAGFLAEYWILILVLVLGVFLTNTFINAIVLRGLGESWHDSFYSAALLAQIGEFSFILASVGIQAGIIEQFSYQVTIATIAISLLLSPMWISGGRRLLRHTSSADG